MQDIIAKLTSKDDKYACAIADRIISYCLACMMGLVK